MAVAAAENATPPGEPAYKALIAMSAQEVPGKQGPWPPILVTQGDADTINPPSYGYQIYADAGPPKYLLVLHGAGTCPRCSRAASGWPAWSR